MQQKIKGKEKEGKTEEGLVIERRFTSAGEDPFGKFDWIEMDAEIRNPDGSMADSITGVKLLQDTPESPGRYWLRNI